MAKISYVMLMRFLVEKLDMSQKEVADCLAISKSTISRMLSGKKAELSVDITCDFFCRKLFLPQVAGIEEGRKLYRFLREVQVLCMDLEEAYSRADAAARNGQGDATDLLESFLKLVVAKAEKNRCRCSDEEEAVQEVGFAPCKYHLAENFVGRENLIQEIADNLARDGLAIICGMGGLGKSQSALYYAEQSRRQGRCSQFQMVFYNKDLSATLLDISFTGLKTYQDSQEDDEEKRVEMRLEILESLPASALLIIDNMDVDLSDKDRKIMTRLRAMDLRILITSRNMRLYMGQYMVKITPLPEEEQLRLFLINYSPDKNALVKLPEEKLEGYRKILQMVSGHTMLIELIAKIMREYSMSPKKILKVLSEGYGIENLKIDVEKDNNYEQEDIYHSVSALFNISNMEEHAKQILMNLSLTSIAGIRMVFFDDFLLDGVSIGRITSLVHQSWIIRETQELSEEDRIHLHPLIRTAVIRNLKPNLQACRMYLDSAIRAYLNEDEEISVIDRRDVCSVLINAGDMFREEYGPDTVELLLRQAEIIHKASQYTEAYRQITMAMDICLAHREECAWIIPRVCRQLADVAVNLAKYKVAIENYSQAIELWEKEEIPPYEEIVKTYSRLANVYRKDSKYKLALDNFRLAENRMDVHGVDNPSLQADIFNNMGIVYINLDDMTKALENYKKGMQLRESQTPQDKRQLAYSYHNIGTVHQRLGHVDEAVVWHEKALKLRQEVYMMDDPVIADSLTMLGNDYRKAAVAGAHDKYDLAEDYIRKGLKIRENSLGPDHPATAWSHESLGEIFFCQRRYEEAKDSFRRCLAIRERRLGQGHAYTAEALVWLGQAEAELGDFKAAREHLERACEIQGETKPAAQRETRKVIDTLKEREEAVLKE